MKNKIIAGACILLAFLAGTMDAVQDKLQFHYEASVFPRGDDKLLGGTEQFWNPAISWKNKWKDGQKANGERFIFSSTALVFITDGWHLFQFFKLTFFYLAIALPLLQLFGLSLWWAGLAIIPFRMAFSAGFTLLFSFLLVRKKRTPAS